MEQNRLKSWTVWASLAGLIYLGLTRIFNLPIELQVWEEFFSAIGTVLVGFGILNNPTNKSGF